MAKPGNAVGGRGTCSGVSTGACNCLTLARGAEPGSLRVGIRIILCALLIRIATAPVGIGQAARQVLMRLSSNIARTFSML